MTDSPSSDGLRIRPATAEDTALIRRLVREARLDPTQLHWPNFLIAVLDGAVAGIGQVRQHGTSRELGSLVVAGGYRKRGVARALIAALEAQAGLPLYLFCAARLEPFYRRFGYRPISFRETPGPLRLKVALSRLLRLAGVRIVIMRKG